MEIQKGACYVVGTPIGNLEDCSVRMLETLESVDFIAAEDTRVTVKLLNHFNIKKPMVSYFNHNEEYRGTEIISRMRDGESCALVSDAGMPVISDPGESLVSKCSSAGIPVYVIPGPTALISALVLSGLPAGRFTFEGFLTVNKRNRKAHLQSLINEQRTMIFYEAPHKLRRTLRDMLEFFGDRRIAIARELTKIHEEVIRTTLSEAYKRYQSTEPRGEFVLVIDGAEQQIEKEVSLEEAVAAAKDYMGMGKSASDAAKQASKESGIKKSEIYQGLVTK